MPDGQPRYKRILLKLKGEAGVGGDSFGIDPKTLQAVSEEIAASPEPASRSVWWSAEATSFAAPPWPRPA